MNVDVCVIGAGPAGLSAATFLAERGKSVVVIDEMAEAGGRLLGQLHYSGLDDEFHVNGWWNGRFIAERLATDAKRAGVRFLLGHSVWGLFPEWRVFVSGPAAELIESASVILANGAAEVPVPIPGWTLPGVMSIGAAQVMATQHRVKPGKRVLVAGIDILSLAITHELQLAGVEVVGVVNLPAGPLTQAETHPAEVIRRLSRAAHLAPSRWQRAAGRLGRSRMTARIGARVLPASGFTAWGIPIQPRRALLEIQGEGEVRSAIVADLSPNGEPGVTEEIEVDTVCIAGGLRPLYELANLAGCRFDEFPGLGGVVPLHGPGFETTTPGIYLAGNVTGIESAVVAMAQGRVAAAAIAAPALLPEMKARENLARRTAPIEFMSNINQGRLAMEHRWYTRDRSETRREQVARPLLEPSGGWAPFLGGDLVLCRCEEVTAAALQAVAAYGLTSAEELKRFSRMTMGHCQGRICQGILAQAASAITGSPDGPAPFPGHRSPIRPVTVAEIAGFALGDEENERLHGRLRADMPFGEPAPVVREP